ncbi:MAG: ComF family protein [Treponema sp.]|nr:ComF family protein [Treponema sp.]
MYLKGGTECIVCGRNTGVVPVCKACNAMYYDVPVVLGLRRCEICGKPLISEDKLCMECRSNPVFKSTALVVPLFQYSLWNKELLFSWKILGMRTVSVFFAEKVHCALKLLGIKFVVPVPPRKGKIKRLGWDQIEELCTFLEFKYKYKVLRLLERKSTGEQKKLDRSGRLESIGKAYDLIESRSLIRQLRKCGGKMPEHCCLIDDILTTGSTAEGCASLLKKGGVKRVDVISLFTAA